MEGFIDLVSHINQIYKQDWSETTLGGWGMRRWRIRGAKDGDRKKNKYRLLLLMNRVFTLNFKLFIRSPNILSRCMWKRKQLLFQHYLAGDRSIPLTHVCTLFFQIKTVSCIDVLIDGWCHILILWSKCKFCKTWTICSQWRSVNTARSIAKKIKKLSNIV